jgi:hypothetical protein
MVECFSTFETPKSREDRSRPTVDTWQRSRRPEFGNQKFCEQKVGKVHSEKPGKI